MAPAIVVVVPADLGRKSSAERSLQIESFGDIFVVKYVLRIKMRPSD
jgi:hypothetical protein